MPKKSLLSDKNSINAMKRKEQETADASVLFQNGKQKRIFFAGCAEDKNIRTSLSLNVKNILLAGLFLIILFVGGLAGKFVTSYLRIAQNQKSVAIRIGDTRQHLDYDFMTAINFLKYTLVRNGYEIAGVAYAGNLYPKELDSAKINIFVRGFTPFYDLRMNEHKTNVLYVHRYADFYAEEFQNFDSYLSSQRKLMDAITHNIDISFLPSGFVPHDMLIPQKYDFDILYIYEFYNQVYDAYMQKNYQIKTYCGNDFALLSEKERLDLLKSARVVVYEMGKTGSDDETYVPYAVFDLISYGRPIVTNRKLPLDAYFQNNIWLFDDVESMILATEQALNSSDEIRELKAARARTVLYDFFDTNSSFFKKLK